MNDNLKKIIKYGVSFLFVVVSVYFASRGLDYDKLWKAIAEADYLWVIVPIPVMLLSHYFRALRWKTMLSPFMKPNSMINLFSAVMVGYAINNILPRGGEFVRPYVYAKRENVSYSSVFATIIVERVIDVLTLAGLFALALLLQKDRIINALPPDTQAEKLIYIVLPFLAIIILSLYRPFFQFIIKILILPFSRKLHDKLLDVFNKFRKGLHIIKNPSQYFRLMIESLAIWACYALPMYIIFFSFDFQSTLNLGFSDALLLLIIVGVGVTIAPTPGAVGVYHYLLITAMIALYPISKEYAAAYATVTHGINWLVQFVVGGAFFLRERITKIPDNSEIQSIIESQASGK